MLREISEVSLPPAVEGTQTRRLVVVQGEVEVWGKDLKPTTTNCTVRYSLGDIIVVLDDGKAYAGFDTGDSKVEGRICLATARPQTPPPGPLQEKKPETTPVVVVDLSPKPLPEPVPLPPVVDLTPSPSPQA